jgi:3-methyladenine DNA glycosylase AlkD
MTADEIVRQLKSLGTATYKKVLRSHGVGEPVFGVKIEDLKKLLKPIKKDYRLALELYDTGIYDAMYLAGLITDDVKMTKSDPRRWLRSAKCAMSTDYTVPWVPAESVHGRELAMEWIESKDESEAAAGWATLGSLVAITDDNDLDRSEIKRLLERVHRTIHSQPDRVRNAMNRFVIAVGSYVRPLTDLAVETARRFSPITVDSGGTACKVPDAAEYIRKVRDRGAIGKKPKTAKC